MENSNSGSSQNPIKTTNVSRTKATSFSIINFDIEGLDASPYRREIFGKLEKTRKHNRESIKRLAQIISKRISHKGETEKLKDEALAKVYPKKTNITWKNSRDRSTPFKRKLIS